MSVVQGEADESDEDTPQFGAGTPTRAAALASAQVVPGEASESDDEEEIDGGQHQHPAHLYDKSQSQSPREFKSKRARKPEYESLLHKKLREFNTKLSQQVKRQVTAVYEKCTKGVTISTDHLSKLQTIGQETLDILHEATENLEQVREKMDIVTGGHILPSFKKPIPQPSPPASPHASS